LLAESDLNRAQLSAEWQRMAQGAGSLARRATTVGAWALPAALLVAGIAALRPGLRTARVVKSAWFPALLQGARLASAIWLAFRARGGKYS
jgi:hypothetical protein